VRMRLSVGWATVVCSCKVDRNWGHAVRVSLYAVVFIWHCATFVGGDHCERQCLGEVAHGRDRIIPTGSCSSQLSIFDGRVWFSFCFLDMLNRLRLCRSSGTMRKETRKSYPTDSNRIPSASTNLDFILQALPSIAPNMIKS
jgi:hypothetical protein